MFTTRTMCDRLLRIYDTAPQAALDAAEWYSDVAARDCERIATDSGLPFRTVAAVMAVTSPGPRYATNVVDTAALCAWRASGRKDKRPTCSTYGPNVEKAAGILSLAAFEDPSFLVTGPKVSSFFRNIMGDWSHVTLDRHAVRPISKAGKDVPANKTERGRMEDAYRKAAAKVGLEPAMFQAVVWVAVRGAAE
jgi:hypothetical protein